jgi:hypothetical protein
MAHPPDDDDDALMYRLVDDPDDPSILLVPGLNKALVNLAKRFPELDLAASIELLVRREAEVGAGPRSEEADVGGGGARSSCEHGHPIAVLDSAR